MPTLNQLLKNPRRLAKSIKKGLLYKNPQKKGTCVKLFTRNPKKPNSALRKMAKVRLAQGVFINAYIPGEAHTIPEHATVLIRGGRVPDLPGVKYKIVRGAQDVKGVSGRKQGRSRYGEKRKE